MTLQELWMVIARHWKMVVALPLVCALICGGFLLGERMLLVQEYTASAYVIVNSQFNSVFGIASNKVREYEDSISENIISDDEVTDDEVSTDKTFEEVVPIKEIDESEKHAATVYVRPDANSLTVRIVSQGEDANECVRIVNEIAKTTNKEASEFFTDSKEPYTGIVEMATEAEEVVQALNEVQYLIVAILGGLFAAICIAVVLDLRKRSVKTPESIQEAVELPVLEMLPAKDGERLLANIRFAVGNRLLSSVLFIPSGDEDAAENAADLLKSAVVAESELTFDIQTAKPLSQGMAAAYAACDVDAVVIVVRQWVDSLPQLESTVAELRLAGAKIAGTVFVHEKLGK